MLWQWLFRGGVQLLANDTTVLNTVEVSTDYLGESTENSNSYGYKASKAATGLELSILRTPQSTDALTNKHLQDNLNPTYSVNDTLNNVIGVNVNKNDSQRIVFKARKMDINNVNFDGYDGINFIFSEFGSMSSVNDVSFYDRVEIIRGATGLMRGAGNPSASINFVRKVPNISKDFTKLGLSAGSWSFKRVDLDASYALNEARSIKARLNVASQNGGSYIDRYKDKKNAIYGVVDFNIGDSSLLRVGGDYTYNKTKAQMWGNQSYRYYVEVPGSDFPYLTGELTNFPINWNYAPDWAGATNKRDSEFIKFQHFFANEFELNIDLVRERFNQDWQMFSAIPVKKDGSFEGADMPFIKKELENKGIDIKLNGSYTLAGLNNDFLLGLGYMNNKFTEDLYSSPNKIYGWRIKYPGRYFEGIFGPKPKFDDKPYGTDNVEINKKAIYFSNKTDFTDKFSAILGLRFTKYKDNSNSNGWYGSYNSESNNLSKYIGFTYEYMKNNIAYLSITDIFTPQNAIGSDKKVLDPIIGTNYEIGLKSQFFDNNLLTSFALFETRRNGVAVVGGILDDGTEYSKAVNGAKNRGFEITLNGKPTDKLNVYAGYTYTKAKDKQGKEIFKETPDKTFKLGIDYEVINNLNIGGTYRWQSGTYRFNVYDSNDRMDIASYSVIDLHTSYKVTQKLKVQANINNALNKRYMTDNWGYMYTDGDPRNFMFRVEYEF